MPVGGVNVHYRFYTEFCWADVNFVNVNADAREQNQRLQYNTHTLYCNATVEVKEMISNEILYYCIIYIHVYRANTFHI